MNSIESELTSLADPVRAQNLQRFFKTGKGEYGEGDVFLGLKVPQVRQIVKKHWRKISLAEVEKLLRSKYHEVRLCALLILVEKFKHATPSPSLRGRGNLKNGMSSSSRTQFDIGDPENAGFRTKSGMTADTIRKQIYNIYIANTKYINNWDLVDLTAGKIVGAHLDRKPKDLLYTFAKSNDLWQRRIAIIATSYYIGKGESHETIKTAKVLLRDKHDLIHKAVGWMLREVGKRCSQKTLTDFLDQHSHEMPRTMLRYAIERLLENKRQLYLKGEKY